MRTNCDKKSGMTAVIPLLQAFVLFCGGLGHLKVNLAQIDVRTHDGDHHGIAQAPVPAGDGVGQAHALGEHRAGGVRLEAGTKPPRRL